MNNLAEHITNCTFNVSLRLGKAKQQIKIASFDIPIVAIYEIVREIK